MSIEQYNYPPKIRHHLPQRLASHTLWVCFLDPDGFETFTNAEYTRERTILPHETSVPKLGEISTVQYWDHHERVTILPTSYSVDGELLYMTVQAIADTGEVPAMTVTSLKKRLLKQPHRNDPKVAFYPLLQLPPFE